jgi:CRISPR-associated protein Cmr6
MATNASFIYYRDKSFGKNLDKKDIKEILDIPESSSWSPQAKMNGIKYLEYFVIPGAMSFSLNTTYPGLVIGAGYNHPAGEMEEGQSSDFQLGFYFDHTSGMPIIPGSTVKGVLKSVFPKERPKEGDSGKIKSEKLKYVNGLLRKDFLLTQDNWEKLFEKGNIFFDAYIWEIPSNQRIFAEDYITPHKDQFKNPIPIRFLKIAPDVTFTFQFKLIDSNFDNGQTITSFEKLNLFKKILLDFGIGAKRNVGYGNFVEVGET